MKRFGGVVKDGLVCRGFRGKNRLDLGQIVCVYGLQREQRTRMIDLEGKTSSQSKIKLNLKSIQSPMQKRINKRFL